jgi:poly-gamma-glutamate capsule biosynthesis protein CapA/YwtB (metallophosphatase superfamily)
MMGSALLLSAALAAAPLELWFGGDVHLGPDGKGVLDALIPATRGALGVVNLEGTLSESASRLPTDGGKVLLFQHPRAAMRLAEVGVGVASVANNHALDAGPEGLSRTKAALRAAGVLPADGAAARVERAGLSAAVLALNLSGEAPADLAQQLARARRLADVLVVSFHVSGPSRFLPTPTTRSAVDAALEAGAAVVAVHGTHSIGPVERRGAAVVLWGLGNLAFDCRCTDESQSMVVRVKLTKAGAGEATVIPVRAGLNGRPVTLEADGAETLSLLKRLGSSPLLGARF